MTSTSRSHGALFTVILLLSMSVAINAQSSVDLQENSLSSSSSEDLQWDYILVVFRWPPAVCALSSCFGNPSDFTLHGLWPTRNGSFGEPNYCSHAKFDLKTTLELLPLLKKYWTDLEDPTQKRFFFWEHEWHKHGTCAVTDSDIRTQKQYFEFALQFRTGLNILSWFEKEGVIPSTSTKYPLQKLISTIKNETGIEPLASCQKGEYFDGLFFCLSKDLQLFECDHSQTLHVKKQYPCQESIFFLPTPGEKLPFPP